MTFMRRKLRGGGRAVTLLGLEALHQHLIDVNEVTLSANTASTPIDGSLETAVTGEGRTLAAI